MSCEYLKGRQVRCCGAFASHFVLSLEELESKCDTEAYHKCKIYVACKARGEKLPLREFIRDPVNLPVA